ncbi:MAG: lytic transglycosylase F [Halieaceae bacterium]|jgi:membrane-bound lytic murein transglycosylase MltF|nr:lytic transglycosylase F [Halieaceae bacterium]
MRCRLLIVLIALLALLVLPACDNTDQGAAVGDTAGAPDEGPDGEPSEAQGLAELERSFRTQRLTGDLDAIRKRGYIRVLVPYSKTFFFYEGARPRGLAYEFMESFAKELRKRPGGGKPFPLTVVYLPTARDRMIPGIVEGLGDIAIAGLTATPQRKAEVDFATHASLPVAEVLVTGPGAPRLETIDDLAGQRVFIRGSSSYHETLRGLNTRLRSAGKPEVKIVEADENLEIEDILELVANGVETITVADDYLARFWAESMEGITAREDIVLGEGRLLGPVVRKNSPQLMAALTAFQKTHGLGTLYGNVVFKRYFRDNPWVQNPNASVERKRFEKVLPLFSQYGKAYDFDVLLLVAQGYQESKLDQATRSRGGAVGVMQIKPATAKGDPVNILDVKTNMDNNIHAGVKYLRHLADDYFGDPEITPLNRHLLAIAAYNAGPTRVQALRRKAETEGLDPNVWFNNVELVSAREVGRHNVDYVRNIMKYWMAFRLAAELDKPVYPQ